MDKLKVHRWARYGHERLYVSHEDGSQLGYFDVKSGHFHAEDSAHLPFLAQAVTEYSAGAVPTPQRSDIQCPTPPPDRSVAPITNPLDLPPLELGTPSGSLTRPPTAPPPPLAEAPQPPPLPEWRDLSQTAAGAAARERALAEREAQGAVRHVVSRIVGAKTEERAWRIGADGEQAVAAQLKRLGHPWRVLHAVPVGERGSDIDHVVIGPAGVFTVNAKHHPHTSIWVGGDTVMVGGRRVPYVRNSRHEARRASKLLSRHTGWPVPVVGLIAVVGAHDGFTIKRQPEDGAVVIVQRRRISQYLRTLPLRLDSHQIDAVFDIARRSTTWRQT